MGKCIDNLGALDGSKSVGPTMGTMAWWYPCIFMFLGSLSSIVLLPLLKECIHLIVAFLILVVARSVLITAVHPSLTLLYVTEAMGGLSGGAFSVLFPLCAFGFAPKNMKSFSLSMIVTMGLLAEMIYVSFSKGVTANTLRYLNIILNVGALLWASAVSFTLRK